VLFLGQGSGISMILVYQETHILKHKSVTVKNIPTTSMSK